MRMTHCGATLRPHLRGVPVLPQLLPALNRVIWAVMLHHTADIGGRVLLGYEGLGSVIHRRVRIGRRADIGSSVTIGGRSGHEGEPVIEDDARVLGPIHAGQGASIGGNSVVFHDVPAYTVAVGIPAKVVKIIDPAARPDYLDY